MLWGVFELAGGSLRWLEQFVCSLFSDVPRNNIQGQLSSCLIPQVPALGHIIRHGVSQGELCEKVTLFIASGFTVSSFLLHALLFTECECKLCPWDWDGHNH